MVVSSVPVLQQLGEASPLRPDRRKRRADRIGGSKRRPAGTEPSDEFPAAATAAELRDLGTRLIADMLAGRINPRTAAGLVPLMNLQLRAVEVAGLETRLNKLEQDFAREHERRNH